MKQGGGKADDKQAVTMTINAKPTRGLKASGRLAEFTEADIVEIDETMSATDVPALLRQPVIWEAGP